MKNLAFSVPPEILDDDAAINDWLLSQAAAFVDRLARRGASDQLRHLGEEVATRRISLENRTSLFDRVAACDSGEDRIRTCGP